MKKHLRITGAFLAIFLLTFVLANVADYFRFTRAIARVEGLSEAELRAIGDRCLDATADKLFKGANIPAEFMPLQPNRVFIVQGHAGVEIYRLGDFYVDFSTQTTRSNQEIFFSTNEAGFPKTRSLWRRDPILASKLSPSDRLITVRQNSREWIVLSDRLLVIDRASRIVAEDSLVCDVALTLADRTAVLNTIGEIPASIRGKSYRLEGSVDGSFMAIRFAQDGRRSELDIEIERTWIEALDPLVGVISRLLSKGSKIDLKESLIQEIPDPQSHAIEVMALSAFDAKYYPRPILPWWCVWRSLISGDDSIH